MVEAADAMAEFEDELTFDEEVRELSRCGCWDVSNEIQQRIEDAQSKKKRVGVACTDFLFLWFVESSMGFDGCDD